MKNYVQPGNTITLTAPYAVASGAEPLGRGADAAPSRGSGAAGCATEDRGGEGSRASPRRTLQSEKWKYAAGHLLLPNDGGGLASLMVRFNGIGLRTLSAPRKREITGAWPPLTLHLKARELHNSVQARTISNMVITDRREIMLAAKEYVDLLEEMHRELYPNQQFDRAAQTNEIIAEMTKALEEEKGA